MKLFSTTPNFDFIRHKNRALVVSGSLLLASLLSILVIGFSYGIDFKGGTLLQIRFAQATELSEIRELLDDSIPNYQLSTFGDVADQEILILLAKTDTDQTEIIAEIQRLLTVEFKSIDIRRVETVGPKVGQQLKEQAWLAVVSALIGILLYIWLRFQLKYGIGAVCALFHDVLITLGVFALLGKEINLTLVAALLTIVGYSLNDTIVIFDRIRENRALKPKNNLAQIINLSVNECLSRTIVTSATTLLVMLTLFLFGGQIIKDFSLAIILGLIVGTYSSVFIASTVVLYLDQRYTAKHTAKKTI